MQVLHMRQRLRCAALVALSGGAVAQAMTIWGGQMARFLPPHPYMILAGFVGAGLAGILLADAFGRGGKGGALLSGLFWPIATLLGACLGAALLIFGLEGPANVTPHSALESGADLGTLAVMDGVFTGPLVAVIWFVSGIAVHFGARAERTERHAARAQDADLTI